MNIHIKICRTRYIVRVYNIREEFNIVWIFDSVRFSLVLHYVYKRVITLKISHVYCRNLVYMHLLFCTFRICIYYMRIQIHNHIIQLSIILCELSIKIMLDNRIISWKYYPISKNYLSKSQLWCVTEFGTFVEFTVLLIQSC